jgi:hypothetical protein
VKAFRRELTRCWFKLLRRRSQRFRINWERMRPIATRWLPEVRVLHPYPSVRLAARP